MTILVACNFSKEPVKRLSLLGNGSKTKEGVQKEAPAC